MPYVNASINHIDIGLIFNAESLILWTNAHANIVCMVSQYEVPRDVLGPQGCVKSNASYHHCEP